METYYQYYQYHILPNFEKFLSLETFQIHLILDYLHPVHQTSLKILHGI